MYEAASWGDAAGVLWVLERVALGLAKHRDNAELLPQTAPTPDHTLQVGDDAIFFIRSTELAWRSTPPGHPATRPIVQFMGYPNQSYLRQQRDGQYQSNDAAEPPMSLDEVRQHVQQRPTR